MRVNNDMLCDLAALVEFDDSSLLAASNGSQPEGGARLAARFLRYAFIPGLGVGHPAILYDEARRRGSCSVDEECACGRGRGRRAWCMIAGGVLLP
jgi:hypothetical protein